MRRIPLSRIQVARFVSMIACFVAATGVANACWNTIINISCCFGSSSGYVAHRTCGLLGHDCGDIKLSDTLNVHYVDDNTNKGKEDTIFGEVGQCVYTPRECQWIGCKTFDNVTLTCVAEDAVGADCPTES